MKITIKSWDLGPDDQLLHQRVDVETEPWLCLTFYIDYGGDGRADMFSIDLIGMKAPPDHAFTLGVKHIRTQGQFVPDALAKKIADYLERNSQGSEQANLEFLRGLLNWEFEFADRTAFNTCLSDFRS